MKKTLITMTTVAVVGLSSTIFSATAHAETIGDLESKQSQIKDERSSIKKNLTNAEAKIADVLIDLDDLNTEIVRVNKALKENKNKMTETEGKIKTTKDEVKSLEVEIKELEDAIEKRYGILKERIVSYQKSGGNISYLEVVFGSKNFGDFISRVSAVNKITESDTALMEQQEKDKQDVEKKQDKVLAKLDELNDMKVDIEGMLALIKEQKQENEVRKDKLKAKEQDLVAMKKDLKIKDSNLASLEMEVRQSLEEARRPAPVVAAATVSRNADSSSNHGNLTTVKSEKSHKNNQQSYTKKETPKNEQKQAQASGGGGLSSVINAGFGHLGTPYVWGGKGPGGFDCSGFVSWAFSQGGYSIPSNTSAMSGVGTKVPASSMQPGDLVFFNTYKTNGHVGIYLGGGKFIGAQNSTGLAVASMTSGYWKDHFAGHVRRVK